MCVHLHIYVGVHIIWVWVRGEYLHVCNVNIYLSQRRGSGVVLQGTSTLCSETVFTGMKVVTSRLDWPARKPRDPLPPTSKVLGSQVHDTVSKFLEQNK